MLFNSKHVSRRNEYVRRILENRAKPEYERLLEVDTDESYVHHHHHRFKNNLYHPSIGFPEGKATYKRRRLCFVAATGGTGRKSSSGLIPN